MKKFLSARSIYRNLVMTIILTLLISSSCVLIYKIHHVCSTDISNPTFTNGSVKIEMIDVGNGDSFLILQNDKAMLVDTGYITTYSSVRKTLRAWHVNKLDYVILTHPHRDHVGGFTKLIFDYHIDNIIVGNDPPTSIMDNGEKIFFKLYKESLLIATRFGDKIYYAQNQDGSFNDFQFSNSLVHFIGPISDSYDKVNNYSLVFKLTYGNAVALFTADMEKLNEQELLDKGENLRADILKVAHHGSKTSSSREFLEAVSPTIALVSAKNEVGTMYGHPGISLVTNLEELGVRLYRTDEQGNQLFTMKEDYIFFGVEPGDYQSGTELYSATIQIK